jgi:hypothetical protein
MFTPRPLYPGERNPGTHWIGSWVGPSADLDDVEKRKLFTLPGLEFRSLYRLHYPGSLQYNVPLLKVDMSGGLYHRWNEEPFERGVPVVKKNMLQ